MSRRRRALAFFLFALACAGLAAALAGNYESGIARQLGELRPVVVSRTELRPHRSITPRTAHRDLEIRRIPERFVPPDALSGPDQAIGRAPRVAVPAGSYVLAGQLEVPRPKRKAPARLGPGRQPVEIAVVGAGALTATGAEPEGGRVDVIVTTEPNDGADGRTFVAAEGVELLALANAATADGGQSYDPAGPDAWTATLALTRSEALHLIQAESFAREIRLIPSG